MSFVTVTNLFVVTPVTQYLLKRYQRKGIIYVALFLVSLACIATWLDVKDNPPNYYNYLGVSRRSTAADVKRAYYVQSLKLHPDKNPAPDAAQQFAYLKQVYETLSDSHRRSVYDKHGEQGLQNFDKGQDNFTVVLSMSMFYVFWSVLTFLFTMGKATRNARTWCYVGMVLLLVIEFNVKFGLWDMPYLWWWTPFEQIDLLHRLYPAFMNACRILSMVMFVDVEEQNKFLMIALLQSQKEILTVLADIEQQLTSKAGKTDAANSDQMLRQRLTRAREILEAPNPHAVPAAQPPQPSRFPIPPNILWIIGLYVLFNYILK